MVLGVLSREKRKRKWFLLTAVGIGDAQEICSDDVPFLFGRKHLFFWYIYWLCYYSCPISPPTPPCPPPSLPHSPPYSSCPWVILISSLASTFPTLFLPSPCLFYTYHLYYLFSVPFPPLSSSQSPIDNPPYDLHFCGSVPVLVVCLVFFCFGFRCGC